ncbi:hypothetical protein AAX26_01510 [Aliarcobacter thereius]|uniref:Lipoprotein n=1 Tax=Aliarcobacter thereius TaxID=544718 RepID=A0A1C0B3Y3_9BACT|nr:hypothetical protein [Aliarcobacter thereius]OCL86377.1 hypothetical protein AAX26_01510 [Aliarcobacter thereius]OCL97074.1 hypothetical protein AAX29_01954 [Aliarcobacter thereius]
MRYIISAIILAFIFAGCFDKQIDLRTDETIKKAKESQSSDIYPLDDKIIEEEISNLESSKLNIAFIYPSNLVSKYAKGSINTIAGYLNFLEKDYNLLVIDSIDESLENINNAIEEVKNNKIDKVIALFTPNSTLTLKEIDSSELTIYFPLIEKKDFIGEKENFIFGSISYSEQLKKLSFYSEGENILFYQDTYLGNKLKISYEELELPTSSEKSIRRNEINFKHLVDDERLNNSFIFLNLDIVKSSLILSQLVANEKEPKIIFATQVLYDPVLLTLTQYKDRERLLIANSIEKIVDELEDSIISFGGNINYEWVDYSTLVGINYLINGNNDLISSKIEDNEVKYGTKLFISTPFGFVKIK